MHNLTFAKLTISSLLFNALRAYKFSVLRLNIFNISLQEEVENQY